MAWRSRSAHDSCPGCDWPAAPGGCPQLPPSQQPPATSHWSLVTGHWSGRPADPPLRVPRPVPALSALRFLVALPPGLLYLRCPPASIMLCLSFPPCPVTIRPPSPGPPPNMARLTQAARGSGRSRGSGSRGGIWGWRDAGSREGGASGRPAGEEGEMTEGGQRNEHERSSDKMYCEAPLSRLLSPIHLLLTFLI